MALLHVGMDDTDSVHGMCTTYLAYVLAGRLRRAGAEFADYPRLVRLNPNVPWKTRGNGAVALSVRADPREVWEAASEALERHSEAGRGANPGLVMCEGDPPRELSCLARRALNSVIDPAEARRLAGECGVRTRFLGDGRGLVGALSAVGYGFGDCTAELICYRRPGLAGTPRRVSAGSVKKVQDRYPSTFSSYDESRGRSIVSPRGPDPVLYGLRGESPADLCSASPEIETGERPLGSMIFRTNQGTGDHLRAPLTAGSLEPHSAGVLEGRVASAPRSGAGGHVFFAVESGGARVECAAYKPGGLGGTASQLLPGDGVRVGGGVRPASGVLPCVVNAEYIEVLSLEPLERMRNPACSACAKRMKSKGRGQGFECARCGASAPSKVAERVPRALHAGMHLPAVSAQRHLARPARRAGRTNGFGFDPSIRWLV